MFGVRIFQHTVGIPMCTICATLLIDLFLYSYETDFIQEFLRKVSFLTGRHCQFRGVCQGMKQIYLYLWYPLYQAQWDRYDQQNRQTWKFLVKEHHLFSGT
jgi:hypothetical protein